MMTSSSVHQRGVRRKWRLGDLARDRGGASALEFALIVLPLMALLVGVLTVSLTFFAQQVLETTAEKSVRALMTGSAQKANMSRSGFKALACANLPSFMNCQNLLVDVQTAAGFSEASMSSPTVTFNNAGQPADNFAYQPGNPGQITVVRMIYIWPMGKGLMGFDLSNTSSGQRLLLATSVFKTEPYS